MKAFAKTYYPIMKKFTTLLFCVIPLLCFSQINDLPLNQSTDENQFSTTDFGAPGTLEYGTVKDELIGLSARDLLDLGYITDSNLSSDAPLGYTNSVVDREECTDAYIPRDATYTAVPRNDDGSLFIGDIGFEFSFCGETYSDLYINTNGNLSFGASVSQFSPDGFPYPTPMIAPFWADVDTRNTACGDAAYKLFTNYMIVTWENVGWFSQNCSPVNTFQVIISDGNAPIIGVGNNIQFRYGDMAWTTGTASGGGPFGGTPATVGFNSGDNVNFEQIGRFNVDSDDYDGPFGTNDGVHWLDNKCFAFSSGVNSWDLECVDITKDLDADCMATLTPEEVGSATVTGCADVDIDIDISSFGCLDVGENIITVTADDGSTSISCTSIVTITANNCGVITINPVGPFCAGDPSVPLTGSPAGGTWSGAVDAGGNFNPAAAGPGIHTVVYTNSIACPTTTSIDIEVTDGPSVEITPDPAAFCEDLGFVDLSTELTGGVAPYIYSWQTPSGTSSDEFITATEAGAYSLTVTDASDCTSEALVFVTMNPSPVPTILDPGEICIEESFVTLSALPLGGTWSGASNSYGEVFPQNLGPGSHTVYYIYTDGNGCIGEDVFDITIIDSPLAIAFNLGPYCEGNPIELFGDTDATGSVVTFNWTGPGGYFSNDQNPTDATEAGTYVLEVVSDGCFSLPEITEVVLVPSPILDVDNGGPYCLGELIELFANTGNDGIVIEYEWNGPGGYYSTEQNPIDATEDGVYTATVTIDGCASGIETTIVDLTAAPLAIPSNGGPYCLGEPIELYGNGGAGTVAYYWTGPGAYTSNEQNPNDATEQGVYILTVSVDGCDSQPENTTVVLNQIQAPVITGDDAICTGFASFLDAGPGYFGYDWSTGDVTQVANATAAGTYYVTVTDAIGCTSEASFIVTEYPEPVPTILGSNTFCAGSSSLLDAGDFASYIWSNNESTQMITVVDPGSYSVTVTDLNGCTGMDVLEVTESASLNPTISGDLGFCQDDFTVLDAGGGFLTYVWTGGSTDPTLLVNLPGVYGVTVSDASGCTGEISVTIEQNDLPTVSIIGDDSFCEGEFSILDAGGSFSTYAWSDGSSGQTLTVSTDGTYIVTVTDASGCTNETSIDITTSLLPIPEITGPEDFCTGSSVSLDAGGPYTTYIWSDGSTTQSIDVGAGNTYSVTVTNAGGCTGEVAFVLTENPDLSPAITGTLELCEGDNTTLDVGTYDTYIWSDGTTGQTIEVDATGSYSVTVTDANGCTGETSVAVAVNTIPVVMISGDDAFCEGANSLLDAGGPFVDYVWSEGSSGQTITVATTGTYSVVVTDVNGCTNETSINVSVDPLPVPEITGPEEFCTGSSVALDAGGPFEIYAWSDGSSTQTIDADEGTTYSVTVTNAEGCTGETQFILIENPDLTPAIAGTLAFCIGDNTVLDAGDFDTYIWNDGTTGQTIEVDGAGSYSVTVTDDNGCTGETSVAVMVNDLPTVSVDGDETFCDGTDVTLDAGGPFIDYLWSEGSSGQTIDISATGTYSVTVTDTNGCTNEAALNVVANSNPEPVIAGSTTFCAGSSAILDVGDYVDYIWSEGSSSQTISVDEGNTYSVTVTDVNGCTGETQTTITESTSLNPVISGDVDFCSGGNTLLDAGAGFDTYIWSDGSEGQTLEVDADGDFSVTVTDASGCTGETTVAITINDLPTIDVSGNQPFCTDGNITLDAGAGFESYIWSDLSLNQSIEVSVGGTYTVTVTDANGCTNEMSVDVLENDNPTPVIIGATSFCSGEEVALDAGNFETYIWSDGSISSTIMVDAGGTYTVTVTNSNGCTGETQLTVDENQSLEPEIAGPLAYCAGESVTLSAPAGFDYIWSTGDATQTITVSTPGDYEVQVTDANGCSGVDVVSVEENDLPDPQIAGSTSFCIGTTTTLDAGAGYDSYVWSDGSLNQTLEVSEAGTYSVVVTTESGCVGETDITVILSSSLSPVIVGSLEICEGENSILDAGTGFDSYIWSTGATTQTIDAIAAGMYSVTVSDVSGCTGDNLANLIVNPNPSTIIAGITSFCEGDTPTLDAGPGFDTYLWSDGSTTQAILATASNTYTVTVTSTGNCSAEASIDVVQNPNPQVEIVGPNSFCSGNTATLAVNEVYESYLWTTGETSPSIELTTAATVGVIVTDANGCTSESLIDVIENSSLSPVINGVAEFCEGESTILDAGSGYETYEWTTGETTQTISVTTDGDFGLIVSDADGCSGTTEIAVSIVNNPTPMIAGSTTFCTGSSTTLDVGAYDTYIWSDGSTTSTITTNVPGEYLVTVTNAIGCTGETSVMIEESSSLNPVISGPTDFCEGESVTLDAGAGFDTYVWSTGSTEQTITLMAGTTVGVTVTDLSGCMGETAVTVIENSSLNPVIAGVLSFCGAENSILDAGIGYEIYEWSNGANTQTIEVTETGLYEVLVTDANACTGITNVSVVANPDPEPIIGGSTTFCIGNSTILDAGVFDSYLWSDGSTEQSITTGIPGDYMVTVTTAAGCTGEAFVTIEENTALSPVVLGALVFCEGDNTILDAGNGFDTYLWSDGSVGQTLEVTLPGDYSVTVTDLSGCSGETVVAVEVNEEVNVGSANPPSNFCQNEFGNVLLLDLLIDEDAGGSWTETSAIPSQGTAFDPTTGTFATQSQIPGTYTFQYLLSGGSICPDEFIEVSVIINDLPLAVAGIGVELDCINPILGLNATGSSVGFGFEITWNGPGVVIDGNENTLTPNIENPGVYELMVTNVLTGCSSIDMVEVTESTDVPVALAGEDQQVTCNTSSTILQPAGTYGPDYQITWSGPGITAANMNELNPEVNEPGIYTMTVIYLPNGCISSPDEVEVLNNTTDPTILTDIPLSSLDCNILSIDLIGSSPNPNVSFVWTDANGMVIGTTPVVTGVDQEGTYYLTVTDNLTGCDAVEEVVIVNNVSYPSADAGAAQLLDCNVTVVSLDGSDSQAGSDIVYTWSGPGIVGTNIGATINADLPGVYTITAENTSNGCSTDAMVIVDQDIVNPNVLIEAPEDLDCTILEVTLDGSNSSSGANYSYQWEDADGNSLGSFANIDVSNAGDYYLFIENSTNGCTGSASIEVIQDQNVPQAASIDVIMPDCFGESTGVINVQEIEGGTAPYVYSINGSDYSGSSFYPELPAGVYELALEDANGCEWSTTIEVNEPAALTLDLGLDLELVWGDSSSITAGINIPNNQIDTIIWTPVDQLICTDDNCLEVGVLPSYSFAVSATVIDTNGCKVRDDLIVNLEKERKVFIPNAFSPNGDENNDIFMVYAHDPTVKGINFMRVFNRWGEIVFDLSNLEPNEAADGWDGTFHGEELNPAVFVYIVEVEFIDGHIEMYKGDVTLMK